jgi:D-psicose/D-tagatose/L-ribulose 3-epimerase
MTPSPGRLAAFLTSLPMDFPAACGTAADLGFTHADVVALADRPAAHREALAETGLLVQCAALGRGLPPGQALDATDMAARRAALELVKRQLADAAQLGAGSTYIVPGSGDGAPALACFAEACALLADYAGRRMVRLCVEHVPGRALPSAAATLDWLEALPHPNLFLLLDVGHCLISGEDAAAVVRRAGPRLGYVHLDDNDGQSDGHWPLLTGRLTRAALQKMVAALGEVGYRNGLALELNPTHGDVMRGLREGKEVVESVL